MSGVKHCLNFIFFTIYPSSILFYHTSFFRTCFFPPLAVWDFFPSVSDTIQSSINQRFQMGPSGGCPSLILFAASSGAGFLEGFSVLDPHTTVQENCSQIHWTSHAQDPADPPPPRLHRRRLRVSQSNYPLARRLRGTPRRDP